MPGTDFPFRMTPPGVMVKLIQGCFFLSPRDQALILGDNAARALGLAAPARR